MVSFFKYFVSVKLQDRFWTHLQQSLTIFLWQRGEDGIAHDLAFRDWHDQSARAAYPMAHVRGQREAGEVLWLLSAGWDGFWEYCNDRPTAPLTLLQATKEQCSCLTLHKTLLFEWFTHIDTRRVGGGELSLQISFQSEELSYTE